MQKAMQREVEVVWPIQCLRTVEVQRSHIGGGGWIRSTHFTREKGRS